MTVEGTTGWIGRPGGRCRRRVGRGRPPAYRGLLKVAGSAATGAVA